jgi:hypothetical protein
MPDITADAVNAFLNDTASAVNRVPTAAMRTSTR